MGADSDTGHQLSPQCATLFSVVHSPLTAVMVRQEQRASISENGYFLRLLICLAALLALRIAAIYAAKIDLVLDEAQY